MQKKISRVKIISIMMKSFIMSMLLLTACQKNIDDYGVSLSDRDVALEIGETLQLEVVPDKEEYKKLKVNITWNSSDDDVATVSKDGLVTAVSGGESKIKAIIKYAGKEYSTSCVVTVKSPDMEYSTYKVRWFVQNKDRNGYEIKEETFERLVGSTVLLTEKEASAGLPANYVLNVKKSIMNGTVQQEKGMCILEVYHDVAEITYYADYFFESDTKFGTYTAKETKKMKAYAFSEVAVSETYKEGFVLNAKAKGSVLKNSSVTAGSRLSVYCDRVRSKVNIAYLNGETKTYTNVYGAGLQDAPKTALTDKCEPYGVISYVNGEKKELTESFVKKLTSDTKIEFKVDAKGFTYIPENGGTLLNTCGTSNTDSYAYMVGASNTIYLKATYHATGTQTNMYGISLRCGDTTRELRFQHQGVGVMRNHTTKGGTLVEDNPVYAYNTAAREITAGRIWAQNLYGNSGKEKNSVVSNMVYNTQEGSYDVIWALWEGTIYASVEGEVVVALPLTLLDESWTADKKFEIGFSAFDGLGTDDGLKISDVAVKYGKSAKQALVTDKQVQASGVYRFTYEPIYGTYLPASIGGSAYLYGTETAGNSGISADIKWIDKDNTTSGVGVTVKVGNQTEQYVIEGMTQNMRHQSNHKWGNPVAVSHELMKSVKPFDENGTSKVCAYVKDGYFYITYNGVQAACMNLQGLFADYTKDSKVSVGICSWDACNGLASFENVKILSEEDVAGSTLKKWGYYSENIVSDGNNFADGTFSKKSGGWKHVQFLGSSNAWQIEGTMKRPGTNLDELMFGFTVSSGDTNVTLYGYQRGFLKILNSWSYESDAARIRHKDGNTTCAFNTKSYPFFKNKTTTDELDFKAVVYEDVLYVWFDGEICWRASLTDAEFGGFAEGSKYQLKLSIAELNAEAGIENMKVKMGYEVTEQKNISQNMKALDANITRWESFNIKTLQGTKAEQVGTIETTNGGAYAYLKDASTDVYLSATWQALQTDRNNYFAGVGIKLKGTDKSESRQVYFGDNGLIVMSKNGWDAKETLHNNRDYYKEPGLNGNFVWAQNWAGLYGMKKNNTINKMRTSGVAGSYRIVWAITDGVLYGSIDGEVVARLPLTELNTSWTAEKEYQIGFSLWDINANGDVQFKDIQAFYGKDAKEKLAQNKKVVCTESKDMDYEALTGSYISRAASGSSYLYGAATKETQAIRAEIIMLDKANTGAAYGITVKSGTQSAQVLVEGQNKAVRIQFNHGWGTPTTITNLLSKDVKPFDEKGVCQVTAVVRDKMLYVLYNGKQAGAIELYKLLPGYEAGDVVQLGICGWDANNGLAKFTEISFVSKKQAEKIEVSQKEKWDIAFFTSKIENATVDYTKGVITKKNDSLVNVELLGSSDLWEVSGKITRTDTMKDQDLLSGFRISVGSDTLRVLGNGKGICFPWNFSHNQGNTTLAFNPGIADFYDVPLKQDTINFKAIIANDVLYVWFGFGKGELIPSWRVQLDEPVKDKNNTTVLFKGFASDSKYKFGFEMASVNRRGNFNQLIVKTGDEVDRNSVEAFESYYNKKFGN